MLKYFLLWFPMLLLAILNGAARDLGYKKLVGELTAHQLSTLSLLLLFAVYIGFVMRYFPPPTVTSTWYVGLLWLVLTLGFEFGFGLYRGTTWAKLLADYNLVQGRVWVLIPIWVTIAPYILYKYFGK